MSDLARILARALALDVEQFPDGPPAESVTSRTRYDRRRPERIVTGKLHPTPSTLDCSPTVPLIGGAA